MSWLNHPKFVPVRDSVLESLRRKDYTFRLLKHVLFLCGGRRSPTRDRLAQYIRARRSDTLVFYADAVWSAIAGVRGVAVNALHLEEKLASLADVVVIVVESPGTFAELGAFSLSETLRKKLLPILDISHRGKESFIETGPIRWVDADSTFKPSVWLDHATVLANAAEIDERLARIKRRSPRRMAAPNFDPKHLLFFVCDLVAVFGPCSVGDVTYFLEAIVGAPPTEPVVTVLQLAKAMQLITSVRGSGGEELFARPVEGGRLESFHFTGRYRNIPTLRARVVSVMQVIGAASSALKQMSEVNVAAR